MLIAENNHLKSYQQNGGSSTHLKNNPTNFTSFFFVDAMPNSIGSEVSLEDVVGTPVWTRRCVLAVGSGNAASGLGVENMLVEVIENPTRMARSSNELGSASRRSAPSRLPNNGPNPKSPPSSLEVVALVAVVVCVLVFVCFDVVLTFFFLPPPFRYNISFRLITLFPFTSSAKVPSCWPGVLRNTVCRIVVQSPAVQ